jgi:RNA polymerase sigma-70 factor (ECF subfamily)
MLTAKTQPELDTLDINDDVALVDSAKQGDMAAFEQLVNRHTAMIFRVVMHITNSREDAEDIVQDAFLKAFQHLQHLEERSRFSTWLTRIAVNEALTKLRSSRRASIISMDDEIGENSPFVDRIAEWGPNPEQLYNSTQLKEILQQALAALPHAHRVVFLLRDVEGLSIAETAETLGLTFSNVRTRLHRARLELRQHLSRHFERGATTAAYSLPLQQILGIVIGPGKPLHREQPAARVEV